MCGILGQVDYLSTSAWNESKFKKALSLQKHRGPDDSGWLLEKILFLAIDD